MLFTEAFRALGYEVAAPRSDWSAERENGVCLSLWAREIKFAKTGCSFHTEQDAQPIVTWSYKPGFTRRLRHLSRAVTEFDGEIDVVLVSGTPGGGYEDAYPWRPEERKAAWFVTTFDPGTGHFFAQTRPVGG